MVKKCQFFDKIWFKKCNEKLGTADDYAEPPEDGETREDVVHFKTPVNLCAYKI